MQAIHVGQLDFDVSLGQGYDALPGLEPDLRDATEKILWSDHMVWVHPIWWFSLPAVTTGFIDRTFLPGVTFKYEKAQFRINC